MSFNARESLTSEINNILDIYEALRYDVVQSVIVTVLKYRQDNDTIFSSTDKDINQSQQEKTEKNLD